MLLLDKALRRLIRRGQLKIVDHDGRTYSYGTADPDLNPVSIRFTDAGVSRGIARDPGLGAAEAWMDGRLLMEEGEILDLVTIIRRNRRWEERKGKAGFMRHGSRIKSRLEQLNWHRRARRNVAHHYDLGDQLYTLFLDRDMQYSCAYFTDPANGLDQAQEDKKAHIAAKLALKPGQRVLDIGCGWGGMALYLHAKTGADVTGITLSAEQIATARQRASEAGVADKVRFELIDYRDVTGTFDRIVSVGMFEHVGPPFYRTFFRKCRELLAPDGVMLLHTIGRMGRPGTTDRFTEKYIFPGGYIPALSEIVGASERERLIMTDCETLRLHYYYTIRHWYDRTKAHEAALVDLYDARFYRLWLFYLAGAMTMFSEGGMVNYQLQYALSRRTLPLTRDYMGEAEGALRTSAWAKNPRSK
ncbi:cyclopropane-fatty-acyl-phospholipid synthase family protein [Sphingosinicella rhizophila]|uniref:Cyclopropane-fatty-acyl-phospholipid synthase family protein n=1 Tax=Sphingosinicella rhizophila TaxID=3050082 RepID=A0ABU3QB24_9SPHN|nr:cyclopropane-fatty-acyl-phospholipid synthase family protein [Sphingosinicella sp. GR2756]MDT9600569.1 cyclopropane-fatty-acyl-phospholipid synthase family protein [Sphingosinicella sp. GR2756]